MLAIAIASLPLAMITVGGFFASALFRPNRYEKAVREMQSEGILSTVTPVGKPANSSQHEKTRENACQEFGHYLDGITFDGKDK